MKASTVALFVVCVAMKLSVVYSQDLPCPNYIATPKQTFCLVSVGKVAFNKEVPIYQTPSPADESGAYDDGPIVTLDVRFEENDEAPKDDIPNQ